MDYMDRYAFWRNAGLPEDVNRELDAIQENEEELKGRFSGDLQFGTAGMRGIMGAGSNRLNRYTVRRAAQGMAAWLSGTDLPQIAAIGYDSRHNSQLFAEVCAVAFAEAGIHTWLYDRLAPTPMLSFAVRELGCGCGIVISASHNAGAYNGVKCYGPDGCQMTDEPAAIVTAKIAEIPYFIPESKSFAEFMAEGKISYIGQEVWEKYYQTVLAEAVEPEMLRSAGLNIVYTPLCGTGNEPVREVLGRLGVNITVVGCQEKPDGDFKTCEYPNPETDAALNESYKVARSAPCDVILGTDPDADRVAIAVPDGDGFRKLSGNELGCMLMEYILKARTARGDLPEGAEVVRSIVSSPLADQIAKRYGVEMKAVLTGFKYIGGEILELENAGQQNRFIFGFEESCGYLKGTYARDKDAVVASMLVCEMAASLKKQGKTILDALNELYATYGYYLAYVQSIELTGADAMEKAAAMMTSLRESAPDTIGGAKVTGVRDYRSSVAKDLVTGQETVIHLPKSNVLEFLLGSSGSLIARPSGTEPKVKFYYTAVGETQEAAKALLEAMKAQMAQ
ncbi:MAG TPA: phospho-sugar mutase [Candidatus Faecousia intestinigallinarum]|nr:phospho-sugar mutase [Candidatus Faecousia intestinigallinarum]